MKNVLVCLALAVTSAQAGLILTNNHRIEAYGFGAAPSILTLQRNTLEEGCVVPTTTAAASRRVSRRPVRLRRPI